MQRIHAANIGRKTKNIAANIPENWLRTSHSHRPRNIPMQIDQAIIATTYE